MPEHAHVTSIDAIETFRSSLVVFLSRARPVLDDVSDDVNRTRAWLQSERRVYWEHQLRQRTKALEQAQQALFSAEMARLRSPTSAEQMALTRARRAVAEAEDKLKVIKRWSHEFDSQVEPLARQLEQLRDFLASDMAQAVGWLGQVIKTLDAYTGVIAPGSVGSTGQETEGAGDAGTGSGKEETA